jgi:hypothetical protein
MDGMFTVCSSIRIKHLQDKKIKHVVVNRIYNFLNKWSWKEVLQDVADLEDSGQTKLSLVLQIKFPGYKYLNPIWRKKYE